MPARLATTLLVSLSACSLDYLELHTDDPLAAAGAGGGAGAGGCPCGSISDNVIYDENFNATGWCNPDLGINAIAGVNARLDPDHAQGEAEACEALALACFDPSANCEAYASDTFTPAAGPIYFHARIKFNGRWALESFTSIYLLDIGKSPIPRGDFDITLIGIATGNGFQLRVCSFTNCGAPEYVLASDSDWHTVVIYNPHDGVGTLQYRWDGSSIRDTPAVSWTADKAFSHLNIGWDTPSLLDGPDLLLDDLRICNENGAAECGWE